MFFLILKISTVYTQILLFNIFFSDLQLCYTVIQSFWPQVCLICLVPSGLYVRVRYSLDHNLQLSLDLCDLMSQHIHHHLPAQCQHSSPKVSRPQVAVWHLHYVYWEESCERPRLSETNSSYLLRDDWYFKLPPSTRWLSLCHAVITSVR